MPLILYVKNLSYIEWCHIRKGKGKGEPTHSGLESFHGKSFFLNLILLINQLHEKLSFLRGEVLDYIWLFMDLTRDLARPVVSAIVVSSLSIITS